MHLHIDKNSPVPSHYQLYNALKAMIASGELAPGQKLPLEQELVRASGLSRITVRQSVQLLCDDGLARKVRSRGAYVRKVRVGSPSGTINSFSGSMREQGFVPSSKILDVHSASPLSVETKAHFAHVEEMELEQDFSSVRRVIYASGVPVLISTYHLSSQMGFELTSSALDTGSLYALFTQRGIKVHEADQMVELGIVSREEAELLGLKPKSAVMLAYRADYSADGELIGLTSSIIHPRACKLRYAIVGAGLTQIDIKKDTELWAA